MPEEDTGSNYSGFTGDPFLDAFAGFLVLAMVGTAIQQFPEFLSQNLAGTQDYFANFSDTNLYGFLFVLAAGFSAACIAGTVYASMQLSAVRKAERADLKERTAAAISGEDTENKRWQKILSYAASDDHELWRLAIIEADVMLDEMLETMGYHEDTLGAKLRNVERADFRTIDAAWEAHKMRNVIAHEGATYDLKKREVEKTIDQYRRVFAEFEYI